MFKTTPQEALPPMRAGERESRAGGEQYCLSPLPLPTESEYAVDVAHIDVRHDEVSMDIRQGASPDSLMTAGHMLSVGLVAMTSFGLLLLIMAVIKNTMYGVAFSVWGGAVFHFPVCFLCWHYGGKLGIDTHRAYSPESPAP
ncbi:hypothetical protein [Vreelandella olivaria]|uniref:hypothetical protein n=1 Tax=Vreelandella olivaria TaxID=390919 RepID=UPI00201F174F|nr:hypothetical protein [Halomonas olivaria]